MAGQLLQTIPVESAVPAAFFIIQDDTPATTAKVRNDETPLPAGQTRALPNRMLALLLSAPAFSRILHEDVDLTFVDLCRDSCCDLAAG